MTSRFFHTARLALRMLWRDLVAGEITLLALALVVAVASMTSVGFFTDRISVALEREANQVLGGDLLISADAPLPPALSAQAAAAGLASKQSISLASMAASASGTQLVGVKAVESGYPLRGVLRTAPGLNQPDAPVAGVPAVGEAWVDERLASALGVGPHDEVMLGNRTLKVSAVLTYEPDRGVNFFAIVPRLMINLADLPATGLVQPGSRVNYRLHLAGPAAAVQSYRDRVAPHLARGQSIEGVENARPELRSALDRAQRFLRLSSLLAVVLAAVAIGLSARRFMERHLNGCAAMRCFGATSGQLLMLFGVEFLALGVAASMMGAAIGFAVQLLLAQLLGALVDTQLPAPSVWPLLQGVVLAVVLLLGFLAPHMVRLARVPSVQVIRRDFAHTRGRTAFTWALGAVALAALMVWIAGEWRLGAVVAAGFAAALGVFAVLAWCALKVLSGLRHRAPPSVRLGLASMHAKIGLSVMQAMALGLGLMAVITLSATRTDLIRNWENSVPPDAPNRFIINIQPEQRQGVIEVLAGGGVNDVELKPMVRGRLVAVNGRPVGPNDYTEDRAQRLVEREFNLSYDTELPWGNKVVAGQWHGGASGRPQFSVEAGLAQTLGLKLGDTLRFEIAGAPSEAVITSLRALRWDSMRVNFFVIAPPETLQHHPTSFITAFHVRADQQTLVESLVKRFPNLTVIDVSAVLSQFQHVLAQLARAVECVFVFAILAGLAVLWAALASTHDERRFEVAVLRTLGAQSPALRRAQAVEFCALGLVAGGLGATGAAAIGWALATFVFKLPFEPGWVGLMSAVLLAMLGVMAAGLWGTRSARCAPVMMSMRAEA